MAQLQKIQIRRGTKAQLDTITLLIGELGLTTDTLEVFVGNGSANIKVGRVMRGTLAARPTAGVDGRLYLDTTNNELHVDDGTDWQTVGHLIDDLTQSTSRVWSSQKTADAIASAIQGLIDKGPAKVLADTNQTLSGVGQLIDNYAIQAGDIVLLVNQGTQSQNGPWVAGAGAWTRPANFATGSHASNAYWWIEKGDVYKDTGWHCTTDYGTDIVDTDPLMITQFSGSATIAPGTGLSKTGNTIQIGDGTTGDLNGINRTAGPNGDIAVAYGDGLDQVSNKIVAKADAVGGANIAPAINVSGNGLSVKVDDASIKADPTPGPTFGRLYIDTVDGGTFV